MMPCVKSLLQMISFLMLCMTMGFSHSLQADTLDVLLKPYKADYKIFWKSMAVGVSHHQLHKIDANTYYLEVSADPLLTFLPYGYSEQSRFQKTGQTLRPERYEYRQEEGSKKKQGIANFDWQTQKVLFTGDQPDTTLTLSPNTQDKITYFFLTREGLMNGKKTFDYQVADGDSIKPFHLEVVGESVLETQIGNLNTIQLQHISRKRITHFWVAKELQYLLVKVEQKSHKGNYLGGGEITSFTAQ